MSDASKARDLKILLICGGLGFFMLLGLAVVAIGLVFWFSKGEPAGKPDTQPAIAKIEKTEKPAETEPPVVLAEQEPIVAEALRERGVRRFSEGIATDDDVTAFEGIQLLEEAVLKDYNNRTAWVELADAYLASRNMLMAAEAIEICERLLIDEKDSRDLLFARIASGYLQIDNLPAALAIAGEAVKEAPDERLDRAASQLALIAGMAGKPAPAIEALTFRIPTAKKPAFAYLMLASLHELDGDKAKAVTALSESLKTLEPQTKLHARAVAELKRLSP